jgi:hypothetical protein
MTEITKAYVHRTEYRREPPAERNTRDVWFTTNPKDALYYETREEAESDALVIFEHSNIKLNLIGGLKHPLKDFRVEELGPKEFVIFCEGPFAIAEKTK